MCSYSIAGNTVADLMVIFHWLTVWTLFVVYNWSENDLYIFLVLVVNERGGRALNKRNSIEKFYQAKHKKKKKKFIVENEISQHKE